MAGRRERAGMAVRRSDLERSDDELREWVESIDSVLRTEGPERAKALFRAVRDYQRTPT